MRYTWPAWAATVLGAILLLVGLVTGYQSGTMMSMMGGAGMMGYGFLLLSGAILLAAGLHALQGSYDACCGWGGGGDGCGCCGDSCSCGDCGECGPGGCKCCGEGCKCGDCGECGRREGGGHGHGDGEHAHSH